MSNPRYALLSVSDKSHIIEFATQLHELGFHLLSTGGTATHLSQAGLPVTAISELTQFPEILGGRVKTLHPKVHAGILHRGEMDHDTLKTHEIQSIDIVAVNLYPFQKTIENGKCTLSDAIEQIDIGGPCMIRAAAKNHQRVWVVSSPADYTKVAETLRDDDETAAYQLRQSLAVKAYAHTAQYDATISAYLAKATANETSTDEDFPATFTLEATKAQLSLRYGENPHQKAAVYHWGNDTSSLLKAIQHQGKPLSYNNLLDGDAAYRMVQGKNHPFCVIVKHNNPCGVATADNILEAYEKAYQSDPVSAFGGIIAINRPVDEHLAQTILEKQFLEVLIAPGFTQQALAILKQKPNLRALELPTATQPNAGVAIRTFQGGLLVQDRDQVTPPKLQYATARKPTPAEEQDLLFAWEISQHVTSNAIVYAKNGQTVGIGAGQMSRVFSAEIGLLKANQAKLSINDSVMASDAFFPFPDSVENAAANGVTAIIQPGGSMRDHEVIECANQYDIAMILTGERHFKH